MLCNSLTQGHHYKLLRASYYEDVTDEQIEVATAETYARLLGDE